MHTFIFIAGIESRKPKIDFFSLVDFRGGSRISGKGVHIHKGVRVHFADFISFFLNIP